MKSSLIAPVIATLEVAALLLGLVMTNDIVAIHRGAPHAPVPSADAIVSLGGDDGTRARHALALYRRGMATRILLLAADSPAAPRGSPYPDVRGDLLLQAGVPANQFAYDLRPRSTWEEALVAREWAVACGWRQIIVVTAAPHGARALWAMQRALAQTDIGVAVSTAAVDSAAAPLDRHLVFAELSKLWRYRLISRWLPDTMGRDGATVAFQATQQPRCPAP